MTDIRRTILNIQTTQEEGGKPLETPTRLISALAIIRNPWAGRGFVEDLSPEIREAGPVLGKLLTGMILDVTGDALEQSAPGVFKPCHGCYGCVHVFTPLMNWLTADPPVVSSWPAIASFSPVRHDDRFRNPGHSNVC